MKRFTALIITTLLAVLLSPVSLFAANINKDKIVGTWQIAAEINDDVAYKNWAGSVTITRNGNKLSGTLDWSCLEGEWHVRENIVVSVKGNNVTFRGTSVELLAHPEGITEYHLDTFSFSMDDVTEQTVPVSAGDGQGRIATFTISKG